MSSSQIPKGWSVITSFYLCNDDMYNPSHMEMGDPRWHESDYSKEKYKDALRNPNLPHLKNKYNKHKLFFLTPQKQIEKAQTFFPPNIHRPLFTSLLKYHSDNENAWIVKFNTQYRFSQYRVILQVDQISLVSWLTKLYSLLSFWVNFKLHLV